MASPPRHRCSVWPLVRVRIRVRVRARAGARARVRVRVTLRIPHAVCRDPRAGATGRAGRPAPNLCTHASKVGQGRRVGWCPCRAGRGLGGSGPGCAAGAVDIEGRVGRASGGKCDACAATSGYQAKGRQGKTGEAPTSNALLMWCECRGKRVGTGRGGRAPNFVVGAAASRFASWTPGSMRRLMIFAAKSVVSSAM